jgi:hypothetical protein
MEEDEGDGGEGFGGTENAGGWVIRDGCGNPTSITSQDSVRIVLLNPRAGWRYFLLHQSGNEESGREIKAGQISGKDSLGISSVPETPLTLPLPQALASLKELAKKLTDLDQSCCGSNDAGCGQEGSSCGSNPCCDGGVGDDGDCLGDVIERIETCQKESWPQYDGGPADANCVLDGLMRELSGARGGKDHPGLLRAAESVVKAAKQLIPMRARECAAIETQMDAWESKLPVSEKDLESFSLALRNWAVETIGDLHHYRTTDELLRKIKTDEQSVYALDSEDKGPAISRIIEIHGFVHRWREDGCIPALGHDALLWTRGDDAGMRDGDAGMRDGDAGTPINVLDAMEDAAKHADEALALLHQAQHAQVFNVGPVEGNTDVLVTLKVKPPADVPVAAKAPDPQQFAYHVSDTTWISVSVGYPVSFYKSYSGRSFPWVYQGEPTSIFIGGHFCRAETDPSWPQQLFWTRPWCQWFGPMVGLPITEFLDPLGNSSQSNPLELFIGGEFWPLPLISIGGGIAGFWQNGSLTGVGLQSPPGTHQPFGFFGSINIDLPTLVQTIQRTTKEFPH